MIQVRPGPGLEREIDSEVAEADNGKASRTEVNKELCTFHDSCGQRQQDRLRTIRAGTCGLCFLRARRTLSTKLSQNELSRLGAREKCFESKEVSNET
jgi:hypothetical protein